MNILMTGVTGYLGSAIARRIVDEPQLRLFGIKRSFSNTRRIHDLLDRLQCFDIDRVPLQTAFEAAPIDLVVHCATHYGHNNTGLSDLIEANLTMPLRLLDAAVAGGVKAFVNADTLLDRNVSNYSLSKKQFAEWLRRRETNILAIDVALETFFGPGDDPGKFATSIIRQLLQGTEHIPLTGGEQRRDFVFIDDVVTAFVHILRQACDTSTARRGYQRFEVGRGNAVTLKDFVLKIQHITGNTSTLLDFGALPYRPNEMMCIQADLTRLRTLGWSPVVPLEEALFRTVEAERRTLCQPT